MDSILDGIRAVELTEALAGPFLSAAPVNYRSPPPLLGERTEEILRSLGYREEEISKVPAPAK